jgi:RNA polymerase sigma-70 factor (ECF subfamily)
MMPEALATSADVMVPPTNPLPLRDPGSIPAGVSRPVDGAIVVATLVPVFAPDPSDPGRAEVAHCLARGWRAAVAEWPWVAVDERVFAASFMRAARSYPTPGEALARIRTVDLYLATACLAGDPHALVTLDRWVAPEARRIARQLGLPGSTADGAAIALAEQLRERLCSGGERGAPRLREYDGARALRECLAAWAVEVAHDLATRTRAAPAAVPRQPLGPDAAIEAMRRAALQLDPVARALLVEHYAERVSLHGMAAAHRVHRATVARWLARARARVLECARLELDPGDSADRRDVDLALAAARRDFGRAFRRAIARSR